MDGEEYSYWQDGDIQERVKLALKYLRHGESVILDSLGENITSDGLNRSLEYVKGVLTDGFKVALYPPEQRTSQYRRLILTRSVK